MSNPQRYIQLEYKGRTATTPYNASFIEFEEEARRVLLIPHSQRIQLYNDEPGTYDNPLDADTPWGRDDDGDDIHFIWVKDYVLPSYSRGTCNHSPPRICIDYQGRRKYIRSSTPISLSRLEAEARRLFKLPSHKHIVIIQREPPQATKAIAFNWETSTYVRMQTISVEPVAASSAGAPRPARPTYTGSTYGTTDTSTSGVATFLIWVAAASYIGWVVHRGK